MEATENFHLPSIIVFSISFVLISAIISYSKTKRKERPGSQYYRPEKTWNVLKVIISSFYWYWDKSAEKRSFVEHLYQSAQLKKIMEEGRPKLFKIFNANFFLSDDSETHKKLLLSKECNGRIPTSIAALLSNGFRRGIMWNNGPKWKELRKYSLKKLGQLGFGKNDQLNHILSELLPDFMADVTCSKDKTGNIIPVKNLFLLPVVNVVWCIIGGHKFSLNDENFATIHKNIEMMTNTSIWKMCLQGRLPNNKICNYIIGTKEFHEGIKIINAYMKEFLDEQIKLNKDVPESFVDHFLLEIEKHKNNDNLKDTFNKDQLIAILVDLFEAGMETTSNFLEFSLMYMVQNPEVQQKVQKEIDLVIGKNSVPSYSEHRKSMPYTCATMMETHRMAIVVPIILRRAEEDWNREGRLIKKGTQVVFAMGAPCMNESYWGDPTVFRPERFLNEDNSFITEKMNRVMPFGAGGRVCPGENVSTATSFTLFVGILQKYSITKAIKDEPLGSDKHLGLTSKPIPFHVSIHDRL